MANGCGRGMIGSHFLNMQDSVIAGDIVQNTTINIQQNDLHNYIMVVFKKINYEKNSSLSLKMNTLCKLPTLESAR